MRKLNHVSWTFAISLWIFYFLYEDIYFSLLFSFFCAIISSLPDIDIKITKKLENLNKYTFYLSYPFTLLPRILFRHRTITHSIWLPLALALICELFVVDYYAIIILRIIYISLFLHIFEDAFTVSGVRIFYPLGLNIRFANFNTNSLMDFIILQIISFIILIGFVVMI